MSKSAVFVLLILLVCYTAAYKWKPAQVERCYANCADTCVEYLKGSKIQTCKTACNTFCSTTERPWASFARYCEGACALFKDSNMRRFCVTRSKTCK